MNSKSKKRKRKCDKLRNPLEPNLKTMSRGEEGKGTSNAVQEEEEPLRKVLEDHEIKHMLLKIVNHKKVIFKPFANIKKTEATASHVDLTSIEEKITKEYEKGYSSRQLLVDLKQIHQNMVTADGPTHQLSLGAQKLYDAVRVEIDDCLVCIDCVNHWYRSFYEAHSSFTLPCRRPHALVWAQVAGYPFWPVKVLKVDNVKKQVDVTFFGDHERAWVPFESCIQMTKTYLWSKKDQKLKASLDDLNAHINQLNAISRKEVVFNKTGKKLFDPEKLFLDQYIEFEIKAEPSKRTKLGEDDKPQGSLSGQNTLTTIMSSSELDSESATPVDPLETNGDCGANSKQRLDSEGDSSTEGCPRLENEVKQASEEEKKSVTFDETLKVAANEPHVCPELRRMKEELRKSVQRVIELREAEIEIKRKNWCSLCIEKEAKRQYFCCFNGAYCSYFCKFTDDEPHRLVCCREGMCHELSDD